MASSFGSIIIFIFNLLKAIIGIVVIVIVLYLLYILIFKGYPKFLMDLGTLSFFKKSNLYGMFNTFLVNHYLYLLNNTDYELLRKFLNIISPNYDFKFTSNFQNNRNAVVSLLEDYYSQYKGNNKYYTAIREYFLLGNKTSVSSDTLKINKYEYDIISYAPDIPVTNSKVQSMFYDKKTDQERNCRSVIVKNDKNFKCPAPPLVIYYYNFYEVLTQYLSREGVLKMNPNPNNPKIPDIDKTTYLYLRDKYYRSFGVKSFRLKISNLKITLDTYFDSVKTCVELLNTQPILLYLLYPPNDNSLVSDSASLPRNNNNDTIYMKLQELYNNIINYDTITYYNKSKKANLYNFITTKGDYTKYMWELIYCINMPIAEIEKYYNMCVVSLETYLDPSKCLRYATGTCRKSIPSNIYVTSLLKSISRAYLNLDLDKRKELLSKIIHDFPDIKKYARSTGYLSYDIIMNSLILFVDAHPIFCSVFLSDHANKVTLFKNIVNVYKMIIQPTNYMNPSEMLKDLSVIQRFKSFTNSLYIVDLYFNVYRNDLSAQYEEQYYSNKRFFNSIWKPYYHEIWDMRIMEYFRRFFDNGSMNKAYKRSFKPLWKGVGVALNQTKNAIKSAFKGSGPKEIEEPKQDSSSMNEAQAPPDEELNQPTPPPAPVKEEGDLSKNTDTKLDTEKEMLTAQDNDHELKDYKPADDSLDLS